MTIILTWFITLVCMIGTVLNIYKLISCFYLWALGNLAWMVYDIWTGLYSRAALDFVQFLLAVWGIIEWSKKKSLKDHYDKYLKEYDKELKKIDKNIDTSWNNIKEKT